MLTKFDDFPVHQTAEPLAYLATSDRNAYGRYWFNGYDPDGAFYFGIAFAVYPNREVMDCALSIVRQDGTQDSFRASRRLRGDRTELRVGPMSLTIEEPMRRLHLTIAANRTGIAADLVFHARGPVHEEPADLMRQGVRTVMNSTRYTQFGMWSGHITVNDHREEIDPARVRGTRDRSWGWRWTGEPEAGVSRQLPEQLFWLWAPLHWQDCCTHYGVFEAADGRRSKEFAQIFPAFAIDADFDPLASEGFQAAQPGEHRLAFRAGSRFAVASEFDYVENGTIHTVHLEPLLTFHMMGIGYYHDSWGHGFFKGEEDFTSEHWILSDIKPLSPPHQHVQQVVRATCDGRVGHGVLEQLIIGPHQRYGFTSMLDPSPGAP